MNLRTWLRTVPVALRVIFVLSVLWVLIAVYVVAESSGSRLDPGETAALLLVAFGPIVLLFGGYWIASGVRDRPKASDEK